MYRILAESRVCQDRRGRARPSWWGRRDSNPHASRHVILSHARLPVPTLPRAQRPYHRLVRAVNFDAFLWSPCLAIVSFQLTATDRRSAARTGLLHTAHGAIKTPALLPVATLAVVGSLDPLELTEIGAQMIMANTYHLFLRPGTDRISDVGGLHHFLGWSGPLMTDSGALQPFRLDVAHGRVDDDGVTFSSHIDGSKHRFTPEVSVDLQEKLGADVILAFADESLPLGDELHAANALDRTHRWARRCLEARSRSDQGMMGIVQGGISNELRKKSASYVGALPFDGYVIGGLQSRPRADMHRLLESSLANLPPDKPRHLANVVSPEHIFDAVERGVDTFDCLAAIQLARQGTLFTLTGTVNITADGFREDFAPVDSECRCYTCLTFSCAYIHHLFDAGELLANRLATIHNLAFMLNLMDRIRGGVRDGALREVHGEFEARWSSAGG
ncbi:MAG: Queuine tRNA-ribosyltransferase [Chloroflexi bacterium]|nr:Queuine tRNA-ribosyltransferase [Chloroflexota bacterium]